MSRYLKNKKLSREYFLAELASGSKYGVFIDDTGSPGLVLRANRVFEKTERALTGGKRVSLDPHRKTWVGVIVPPDQMPEVLEQFPEALEELQRITKAEEFHFSDIYAGKNEFKWVDLQVRLGLFKFMAKIFQIYKFPIFVQTLDPDTLQDLRNRGLNNLPERLGPFNLRKHEDVALLFLLIRIKRYIERNRSSQKETACVFVDEGYKRHGTAIYIPTFENIFLDGLVCFAKSSEIHPIQLADFAAFALNRMTLLLGRKKINPLEKQLMSILSPITWNLKNIPKGRITLNELGKVVDVEIFPSEEEI